MFRIKWIYLLFSILCIFNCTIITSNSKLPPYSVVLTFDDGPNSVDGITDSLLNVLKKHEVDAHFSLIGENVSGNYGVVKRMLRDGHDIVNHGYDDQLTLFKSCATISSDMQRWHEQITSALDTTESTCRHFRPSYGIYHPALKKLLSEKGLNVLPITFYAYDAQVRPDRKRCVLENTLKKLRKAKGGIIVLHDGRDSQKRLKKKLKTDPDCAYNRRWVPEITDSLITILKRENYRFVLYK